MKPLIKHEWLDNVTPCLITGMKQNFTVCLIKALCQLANERTRCYTCATQGTPLSPIIAVHFISAQKLLIFASSIRVIHKAEKWKKATIYIIVSMSIRPRALISNLKLSNVYISNIHFLFVLSTPDSDQQSRYFDAIRSSRAYSGSMVNSGILSLALLYFAL